MALRLGLGILGGLGFTTRSRTSLWGGNRRGTSC